jgi:hypothetical protein
MNMKYFFISLLFLIAAAQLLSQEQSTVSVTSAEINNGVVIITIQEGTARTELHCNVGMPNCKKLTPGKYMIVRLPKGHGMYECDNVEVYPGDPQTQERLGQYCSVKP